MSNKPTAQATWGAGAEAPFLKFPPFPDPPSGVTIAPFKKFKGYGIKQTSPNGVEVDTLGIPTVELRVKHTTDACKTNVSRKKPKTMIELAAKAARKEWWEIWAQNEHARVSCTFDPCVPGLSSHPQPWRECCQSTARCARA
jgi:hypothetical protein